MVSFHQIEDKKGSKGSHLVTYAHDTYIQILGAIEERETYYAALREKIRIPQQKKRITRLESLALALKEELTHNPDGTVSFNKAKVQNRVKDFSDADITAVLCKVQVTEVIGRNIPVNFTFQYGQGSQNGHGYILPRIRN